MQSDCSLIEYQPIMGYSGPISITFDKQYSFITQSGEKFEFSTQAQLTGTLELSSSLGYFGVAEFENPHYLELEFDFLYLGISRSHKALLNADDLWFAPKSSVLACPSDFTTHAGPIDGMMDSRTEDIYIRTDGKQHTFRVKNIPCTFDLMVKENGFLVRCKYYDPIFGEDTTIHYFKSFLNLIFLPAPKLYCDSQGNIEDVIHHGEKFISIE